MRVVADSNIFVSAILFGGKPAALLQAAEGGRCRLVVSEPILSEVAEVIARKFEWSEERVASRVARIRAAAEITAPAGSGSV
jgi:predicted nucleic acid-binding protein